MRFGYTQTSDSKMFSYTSLGMINFSLETKNGIYIAKDGPSFYVDD
ncbi:MAG: hypothetical protein ACTHKF_11045 [Candidatus Nitrosocosmicus sp.]